MIDSEKKNTNFDYNYQITEEMILKLMQGKKLHFQLGEGAPRFTFHPPREGVFISHRQFSKLKNAASHAQGQIFYEIEND